MKLTGDQFCEFEQSILSAYPSISSLTRFVRFELEEKLTEIAGGGNLTDVVFNLIEWAQCKGRIDELITKAHHFNPDNPELKEFVSKYVVSQADERAEERPVKPPAAPKKMEIAEMRQHIKKFFDDVQLDELCQDYFPEVWDKFSIGMRTDTKINLLLDYCRRVEARKALLQQQLKRIA